MNTDEHKIFLHKDLTYKILGLIYNIRKEYGAGHKEAVYGNLLAELLSKDNIPYEKEKSVIVYSKYGTKVGTYRPDFIIDGKVILELKSARITFKEDELQMYRYLRNSKYEIAYLINFSSPKLFIKRIIYTNDKKPFLQVSV